MSVIQACRDGCLVAGRRVSRLNRGYIIEQSLPGLFYNTPLIRLLYPPDSRTVARRSLERFTLGVSVRFRPLVLVRPPSAPQPSSSPPHSQEWAERVGL